MNIPTVITGHELTPRQGEVLDAALGVLVSGGDKTTMAAVARAASCSKETLYKWFGDREGLLNAIVQWQASKVRAPQLGATALDQATLEDNLEQFARDLLTVLTSHTSVALNRVAVGQAGAKNTGLGEIVLENGRRTMGRRLKPVLEAGRTAGLLAFKETEEAFRSFFGLVVRDTQIRLLLGDALVITPDDVARDAATARHQFIALYGA